MSKREKTVQISINIPTPIHEFLANYAAFAKMSLEELVEKELTEAVETLLNSFTIDQPHLNGLRKIYGLDKVVI